MNAGSPLRHVDVAVEPPWSRSAQPGPDAASVAASALCPGVVVRRARGREEITAARRLHAEVYVARGYVEPTDLVDGMIGAHLDPWVESSVYFLATDLDGTVVAVSRQIAATRAAQLPTLAFDGLDADVVGQLDRQYDDSVVEISALAVRPGAPAGTATVLYASMWAHSLVRRHAAWVMSIHPVVRGHLNAHLGPVLEQCGPPLWYLGSSVIPAVLWTDTTAGVIAGHVSTMSPARRACLTALFPPSTTTRRP